MLKKIQNKKNIIIAIAVAAVLVAILVSAVSTISRFRSAKDATSYIGLTEEEAIEKAKQNNVPYRIMSRDDRPYPLTMDYSRDRVNFDIDNGIVTNATNL